MTTYVLTYDLNKEDSSDDYKPLIDELKRLGAHKYQYSSWLINLQNTAKETHDHFKAYLDDNDALFVTELVKNYAHSKSKHGTTPWIAENPPSR